MRKKATVEIVEPAPLSCSECEENIYTCDGCKDYFAPNDEIYCDEGKGYMKSKHYCKSCKQPNPK